jgi:hypothetical protein
MEAGGKRVRRLVEPPAREVVSDGGEHQRSERKLPLGVVGPRRERRGFEGGALDATQQRDQPRLEIREQRRQASHRHPGLEHIDQRIVRRVGVAQILGLFALERHDRGEVRQKPRVVAALLRLLPRVLGERTGFLQMRHERRGQPFRP